MLKIMDAARIERAWLEANGVELPKNHRLVPKHYSQRAGHRRFNVHVDVLSRGYTEPKTYGVLRLNVYDDGRVETRRDKRQTVKLLLDEGTHSLAESRVPILPVPKAECERFYRTASAITDKPEWLMCIEPADRTLMRGIDAYANIVLPSHTNVPVAIRISASRESKADFFDSIGTKHGSKFVALVIVPSKSDATIVQEFLHMLTYIRENDIYR